MILLCTILEVVNGKSLFRLGHQSPEDGWTAANDSQRHIRAIPPHGGILVVPIVCPAGQRFAGGRCRKILGE